MSVGPIGGLLGSAAGAPLSQTQGSETERMRSEGARQSRTRDAARQAERTAGIGQTQEDQGAGERDADGRRAWQPPPEHGADERGGEGSGEGPGQPEEGPGVGPPAGVAAPNDPTGGVGGELDLVV